TRSQIARLSLRIAHGPEVLDAAARWHEAGARRAPGAAATCAVGVGCTCLARVRANAGARRPQHVAGTTRCAGLGQPPDIQDLEHQILLVAIAVQVLVLVPLEREERDRV